MKELEEIPSDTLVKMNDFFHRSFNALGCDPMCHCCDKMIPVGDNFKLSTVKESPEVWGWGLEPAIRVMEGMQEYCEWNGRQYAESHEVMLCESCTAETYRLKEIENLKNKIKARDKSGGCFRINGRIVI